jgi:hypothetical protein
MSLNQGENPPDWDTVKSLQTQEQQKSSIDHSLQSSIDHLLICLRQENNGNNAAISLKQRVELRVILQETIDAHKGLLESRCDARIKVLLVERSTSFPPFLTSYVGILTLVPDIPSNRPSTKQAGKLITEDRILDLETIVHTELKDSFKNGIEVIYDIETKTKTKAADILIASKIQE